MAVGGSDCVEVLLVTSAVLNVEQEALGVQVHVNSLIVRRRCKGVMYVRVFDMRRLTWCGMIRSGWLRVDGGSGVWLNPLLNELVARQKVRRSKGARCAAGDVQRSKGFTASSIRMLSTLAHRCRIV